ncbi:hypothetical protein M1446_03190 [Candidatus Dependentiae bacterium]|nr:hypothetical protein [Candidatus Dependentiae bacterium]
MSLKSYVKLLICCMAVFNFPILGFSSLNKNDPYPVFTVLDPYDFLTSRIRASYKYNEPDLPPERANLSISGYTQKACRGTDFKHNKTDLGNLLGPWNVVGFFYDPNVAPLLLNALGLPSNVAEQTCVDFIKSTSTADSQQRFGFFDVPINYRKSGIRFEANFMITCDLGFRINFGVADIRQTATLNDLTCSATALTCLAFSETTPSTNCLNTDCCNNIDCCVQSWPCDCKKLVINRIMKQICTIGKTLNLDFDDFHTTGLEDPILSLFWRRIYEINRNRPTWPYFLFTPYIVGEASLPFGKDINQNKVFSLPTGYNGHASLGFRGGFSFDFVETILLGMEAGFTHWFPRDYCNYRMPTNCLQSGIFPTGANVRIEPGTNWEFNISMSAYHFIERLSVYIQYVYVSHAQDCIKGLACDTPFLTKLASQLTKFEYQAINSSLWYDLSPGIALGFLWQAPVNRRNAYRTNTFMGSIVATF